MEPINSQNSQTIHNEPKNEEQNNLPSSTNEFGTCFVCFNKFSYIPHNTTRFESVKIHCDQSVISQQSVLVEKHINKPFCIGKVKLMQQLQKLLILILDCANFFCFIVFKNYVTILRCEKGSQCFNEGKHKHANNILR